MKLYFATASSSLSIRIALLEAGLSFTAIRVNERTKALEGGGDLRSIHPLGTVPVLVLDDDTAITESAAILQLIADRAPEKRLAPPNGTIDRTRLHTWLNFLSSEMHKGGFGPLFYAGMPEAARDLFRERLKARFAHIDRSLAGKDFLLGNDFSVADAHLYVIASWAPWAHFDLTPYPNVTSHHARVGSRPAVRQALAAEGLLPWPDHLPH